MKALSKVLPLIFCDWAMAINGASTGDTACVGGRNMGFEVVGMDGTAVQISRIREGRSKRMTDDVDSVLGLSMLEVAGNDVNGVVIDAVQEHRHAVAQNISHALQRFIRDFIHVDAISELDQCFGNALLGA